MGRTHSKTKVLYEDSKPISWIIRQGVTSKADIERLAHRLGLNVVIDWIDNHNPDVKLQILNIDADHIGGTHWVAVYDNKHYFDPLGLPIAREWLDHLEYTTIPVQDWRHGGCGTYSLLFLYYANMGEIDRFYNMFE